MTAGGFAVQAERREQCVDDDRIEGRRQLDRRRTRCSVAAKMLNSSCVVPSITGTRLNCPLSNAALIDCGSTLPSTFGRIAPGRSSAGPASSVATGTARRQAAVWSAQPKFVAEGAALVLRARQRGRSSAYAPLWAIARWNRPAASGEASWRGRSARRRTRRRSSRCRGSPPNFAMLRFTQPKRGLLVHQAVVAG